MDKLQYDSFYKLLVSLGLILIALPALPFYYLLNRNMILITQLEYDALSTFSLNNLIEHERMINSFINCLPIISTISITIGILLIIIGSCKWYPIQKQLDKQIYSDTTIKMINAQRMSTSQIIEKASTEASEMEQNANIEISETGQDINTEISETEQDTNTEILETEQDTNTEILETEHVSSSSELPKNSVNKDRIIKYIQIEESCYNYFLHRYSKKYYFERNIRLGNIYYDFIGVSKHNNMDLLFEIKYWSNTQSINTLQKIINQVYMAGINYENMAKRNFISIIVIVCPKDRLDTMRQRGQKILDSATNTLGSRLEIKYIPEEELG